MLGDRLIPLKNFVAQYHHLGNEGTIRRWILFDIVRIRLQATALPLFGE